MNTQPHFNLRGIMRLTGIVACLGLCPVQEIAMGDVTDSATSQPRVEAAATARETLRPTVYPGEAWLRADARSSGFDPDKLAAIAEAMRQAKANGVLIRDGYLIDEWNFAGPAETRFDIQSCTKAITSFAVGLALRDGLIPSVHTPVKQCWPDFEAGPYTEQITFYHLLTMTAGIVQTTDYGTGQDKQRPTEYAEPGTRYNYLNDQTKALATALTYLYGRELDEVMNENLQPLGATMRWGSEPRWDPDVVTADGSTLQVNCGYCRAHFTATELARVGHLYLQGGVWDGKQIIDGDYVRQSLTANPVPASERREVGEHGLILTGGYGYKWRQYEYDGVITWGMHGYGGQFCVIVPEYNVVMVKVSDWQDRTTWTNQMTFYPLLIESLKGPRASTEEPGL